MVSEGAEENRVFLMLQVKELCRCAIARTTINDPYVS